MLHETQPQSRTMSRSSPTFLNSSWTLLGGAPAWYNNAFYGLNMILHDIDSDTPLVRWQQVFVKKKEKKNRPTKIRVDRASLKLQLNTSLKYFARDKSLSQKPALVVQAGGDRIHQRARRQLGWWIDRGHDLQLCTLWSWLREWQSRFTHRFRMTEVRSTRTNERKGYI